MATKFYGDEILWRRNFMATKFYGDEILWRRNFMATKCYGDEIFMASRTTNYLNSLIPTKILAQGNLLTKI